MKKLLTLLAIVLTVQCMAQDNLTWLERYSRIRDTFPLVDTCPEGTTWMNELIGSGCEVVAGCYTKEQQKETREWFYKCEYGGSDGVSSFVGLSDKIFRVDVINVECGDIIDMRCNSVLNLQYNHADDFMRDSVTILNYGDYVVTISGDNYDAVLYRGGLETVKPNGKSKIYYTKDENILLISVEWIKDN